MKDPIGKLEKAREHVASLKQAIKDADSALVPPEVSKQRVEAFVREAAERFEAMLSPAHFLMRDFRIGEVRLTHEQLIDQFGAWLLGDKMVQIIQKRVEEARRTMQDRTVMSDDEVAAAKEDLKRRLFDAEVAEERAIVEAEAAGALVVRRRDADPKAILAA
jgi:hypothetical protein